MKELEALKTEFTIEGTPDTWQVLQHKTGQDFPYKIKQKKEEFVLSKGWSPRVNIPVRYQQIKKFKSLEEAYQRIIKQHNKSCEHMPNWNKIELS